MMNEAPLRIRSGAVCYSQCFETYTNRLILNSLRAKRLSFKYANYKTKQDLNLINLVK